MSAQRTTRGLRVLARPADCRRTWRALLDASQAYFATRDGSPAERRRARVALDTARTAFAEALERA